MYCKGNLTFIRGQEIDLKSLLQSLIYIYALIDIMVTKTGSRNAWRMRPRVFKLTTPTPPPSKDILKNYKTNSSKIEFIVHKS